MKLLKFQKYSEKELCLEECTKVVPRQRKGQGLLYVRDANVRACEWPSDDFMVEEGFKEEFDAYVHNAELEDFLQDKCP